MRFYNGRDTFDFTWDQVAIGFWSRYPNPHSTHVLSEDVFSRNIINGTLVTKRLLTKTNRMPKWGEMLIGQRVSNCVKVVEESVIDPAKKTMVTYTRNIGLTNILSVEEKCIYQPDPENDSRTQLERQVWISSNITGVSRAVTKFALERFKRNASKASEGFVHVLNNIFGQAHPTQMSSMHALTGPRQQAVHQATEKLKERAKMAKEMAKQKAFPVVAAASGTSSSQ